MHRPRQDPRKRRVFKHSTTRLAARHSVSRRRRCPWRGRRLTLSSTIALPAILLLHASDGGALRCSYEPREGGTMTQTGATQREELDREWLDDFTQSWEAAGNSHEPERLLELITEDIVYDDSAWPRPMRGHADVREFLEFTWRAFPDLSFDMSDGPYIAPGQPKAAFHWTGRGTHSGPIDPPGFAQTGKQVEFEGADFHEYRDGRVCRLRIVFDMMGVTRQLGLLPKPGSPVEKAGAAAQRLGVKVQARLSR